MQMSFDETDALQTDIQIIGINEINFSTSESFVADRPVPWLQDESDVDVWSSWSVRFRDLVLLDEQNHPVEVFNLTDVDLSNADNYGEVEAAFIRLATE